MSVHIGSRYIKSSIFARNGQAFIFNIRQKQKFNPDLATYYTVLQGDTLDGIAYKYYGNANLYWAILDANPQYLSEMDIKVGDVIMIPDFSEVALVSE